MIPIPRVRASKISLPTSTSSKSSQPSRMRFIASRQSAIQPHGRSSLSPPMRLKFGWKRPPVARLDEVEDVLAVAEAPERGRERADLEAHLAEEQVDGRDARELGEDRADPLARGGASMSISASAAWMNGTSLAKLEQPVDPVDQRRDLRVGAELGELLVAAVHVPDDRVGGDHALAVEAHDEAQRAVGGGVLRPEVEDHVAGVELDVHLRVGQVPVDRRVDLERPGCRCVVMPCRRLLSGPAVVAGHRLDVHEPGPRLHLAGEQREVLAQRVPLELAGQVQVAQLRVTLEADAVHLPALALVPVGAGVHRHPAVDDGRVLARRRS